MSKNLDLHDLTATAAAAAIKDGTLTSEAYASALLQRTRDNSDLKAFITINEDAVLEAASAADKHRRVGKPLGALHGVPIGVKDSMNTQDLPTSAGTRVLAGFRPKHDATVVAALKNAGAIVFGKNNLVEMSYGLTGSNAHHGQAKNPYDKNHMTGGSSSGAGSSVAARLIPAALGGDTVGSIRVPASFTGVVGFRPSTGRWPGDGLAPISHTLDTAGPMARSVEDCALIDSVVTGVALGRNLSGISLKGVRLGIAPRQHLDVIDVEVERTFRESIAALKAAGAEIVEIDLGDDFMDLASQANWPIFFRETMPHVTEYLAQSNAPVSFDDIYKGLGANVDKYWSDSVVPTAVNFVSEATYLESLNVHRPALIQRYADGYGRNGIAALLFPTTPAPAAPVAEEDETYINGELVSILTMGKNTFPSSCAGLPGITIPMGLTAKGLPMGLEIDGRAGEDVQLLDLAAQIAAVLGPIPSPIR
ncbi:MAG: hypothetical protein JWQ69_923 [Pseudomonas sp.]|nr:hypothetical protein [Pseudomonas sp.]